MSNEEKLMSDDGFTFAAAEKLAGVEPGQSRGRAIYSVPIEVTVSVGKARPLIADIVALRRDSVLPLESRIEDPVEIYVGPQLIARGELQELEEEGGRLGVRLTEIMDLGNGS
ncbi:flagellar motor switch protein FliN/FliY [Rubrimonas cliftonensis]|uniref:Flagellar motor switch protein FliN n=2 Tax=Rubrimonas cliftonensis TaxID=89524 RepID=A0A1H4C641_9RHOB|nr:flagellar motor switch protein FliN/FliY [Rubrimonas cliftonensis]